MPEVATLDDVLARLDSLARVSDLLLHPQPIKIYKPSHKDLSGAALKLELRLEPVWEKTYIKQVKGGLFVDIVPQKTVKKGEDDATFGWDDPKRTTAKFGLPDITAWLLAVNCRWARRPIPQRFRAKGDEIGNVISLFHKFEGEEGAVATTIIEYKLDKESGALSMSKGKDHKRFIAVDLAEEMRIRSYLEHALRAFQTVGKR